MRGETWSTQGITSWSRVENQQTSLTYWVWAKIQPRPHWWKGTGTSTLPMCIFKPINCKRTKRKRKMFFLLIAPHTAWLSYMSLLRKAQKRRCKHMAITPGITSYPSCWPKCCVSHISCSIFQRQWYLTESRYWILLWIDKTYGKISCGFLSEKGWNKCSRVKNNVVHCCPLYLRFRLTSSFSN